MKQISYADARAFMQPGDVIAFGGLEGLSYLIKMVTVSKVSHVGIILQAQMPSVNGQIINQIIESTTLGDCAGVTINRMSTHIESYPGDIWWLPLTDFYREHLDQGAMFSFLLDQVGKPYDAPQAILSALDGFIPDNRKDLDRLFCSELVIAGLEAGGVMEEDINCSEHTPADVCRLPIFQDAFQLKGVAKELF